MEIFNRPQYGKGLLKLKSSRRNCQKTRLNRFALIKKQNVCHRQLMNLPSNLVKKTEGNQKETFQFLPVYPSTSIHAFIFYLTSCHYG